MQCVEIKAILKTPIILGGGYLTLDALLASLIFEKCGDVEVAHTTVPIKQTNGLFHASAALLEPISRSSVSFVASLRAEHDLNPDLLKKRAGALKKVKRLRRSDFGNVLNTYGSLHAAHISWFAEGDKDEISQLLQDVKFIGKRRASGFGEIETWVIEDSDINGVVGPFDEPLRPVPVEMFTGDQSSLKVDAAWKPAYWNPENRAICFAPELIS